MTTYANPEARPRRRPVDKAPVPSPDRRRDPLWAKVLLIVGSLVMIASGAVVVVPKVLANWAAGDIPKAELIPEGLQGANIDGAINVLLLGMDERSNNKTEPIRADTIIIVHIPATHDAIYMISIPRDTKVAIPAYSETGFGGSSADKVNAAFAFGAKADGKPDPSPQGRANGANLTMQTLNQMVPGGLTFHGAAIINFTGFSTVMQALGGVEMCVDVETRSIHFDKNNKYHTAEVPFDQRKIYKVECRHFEYWEALDYARQRHFATGDYVRQRHQQQLLMAIFKKMASKGTLTDLGKLTELQRTAGDLLTLDLGGHAIENWAFTLKSLRPENVIMIKTNGGQITQAPGENSFELLSEDSMQLLEAVRQDKVYEFLVSHQDWIIPSD